ncbi:hypothetical protein QFZ29_001938 [Agromyces albus]|nr:hypothetical protein [Agromyces albus]
MGSKRFEAKGGTRIRDAMFRNMSTDVGGDRFILELDAIWSMVLLFTKTTNQLAVASGLCVESIGVQSKRFTKRPRTVR